MFCKPNNHIGVGINYRSEIADKLIANLDKFDFIEINTERFFVKQSNDKLSYIVDKVPVVLHGLTLSLGTINQDIPASYFNNLVDTLKKIDCKWFSEHIAVTNAYGVELRSLMPVEFSQRSVLNIVKKAKELMTISQKTFLLENIAYYYNVPNSYMSELTFIKDVVENADCGILLDLNNLYVNSINHKYDPFDFINKLPLERVVEVHLAGCNHINDMLVDTHASATRQEVLTLFRHVLKKTHINGVVIERDDRLDNFNELIEEVKLVRDILN